MVNLITLIESAFGYGKWHGKGAHWPSEITDCPRKIVYKWCGVGESNPIESSGWWKIKLGSAVHELCQKTLEDIEGDEEMKKALAWEGFHTETEVRSGNIAVPGLAFPISYRLDNRFVDDDGILAIAEYKTAFGRGMRDIKDNGPKESALAQTIVYMKLSGIRRAYIMYVSRDNADRVLFILDYVFAMEPVGSPEAVEIEKGWVLSRMFPSGELDEMKRFPASLWDGMVEKLQTIEMHIRYKTLPDRPYMVAIKNHEIRDKFTKDKIEYKSDWQCMYCPFMTKCWGEVAQNYPEMDNSKEFGKIGVAEEDTSE
jgi:hypothetical protein